MKNGTRLSAIGGVVIAGALALSACGTDENVGSGSGAAPSNVDCAKGTVNAAGSSAQKNAMEEWANGFSAACAGAVVNYNPSGSGAGIQAFTAGSASFAGSDSALKPEEVAPAKQRCAGNPALNLPMVIGPVAIVYNVQGLDGLQLSGKTLAGIFAGKITKWNAAEIVKDNPDLKDKLPAAAIKSAHRADESGTTDNFTKFLKANAPDIWKWEPGKKWEAPGGQGAPKSDGVATLVKQTANSISYIEMSFAENSKLQTAKVGNGAGEFVELSAESAGKTLESAKVTGTGNDLAMKIDYATKAAGAYPIVLATYEIICEKGLPAEQAKLIKSFLTYTSSADGQSKLTSLGYAPLPATVLAKVQASVKALS